MYLQGEKVQWLMRIYRTIGRFHLAGYSTQLQEEVFLKIEVTFDIDANGIIERVCKRQGYQQGTNL